MNYMKLFPWIGAASLAAIVLGLTMGEDLKGEPQRTLFFGGVIVGCINVLLAALLKNKRDEE